MYVDVGVVVVVRPEFTKSKRRGRKAGLGSVVTSCRIACNEHVLARRGSAEVKIRSRLGRKEGWLSLSRRSLLVIVKGEGVKMNKKKTNSRWTVPGKE